MEHIGKKKFSTEHNGLLCMSYRHSEISPPPLTPVVKLVLLGVCLLRSYILCSNP